MMEDDLMRSLFRLPYLIVFFVILSCSVSETKQKTLRELDIQSAHQNASPVFVKPKSEAEIQQAYLDYLNSASAKETGRHAAIGRLAELEMAKLNQPHDAKTDSQTDLEDEKRFRESTQRTIDLLKRAIDEYPNAKDNDKPLYQLAQNYERLGNQDDSLIALKKLTAQFPKSDYYPEAQFRLGEHAFIQGDYLTAESAYSEVIFAAANDGFHEKALIKRGWSRYKQNLFEEAVDDYVAAIKYRQFGPYESLDSSARDDFDEYFRALSLSAISANNSEILQKHFLAQGEEKYLYYTYKVMTSIYLKQERYSDARDILGRYIQQNPKSEYIPEAYLEQIDVLKLAGFNSQFEIAMEYFYSQFDLKNNYWTDKKGARSYEVVKTGLRENILLIAGRQEKEFRQTKKYENFAAANKWYLRYLNEYSAYARKDKVFTAYAELLVEQRKFADALTYFEQAAYDGDIVLDKEAAYATIELTDRLIQDQPEKPLWLDKYLLYSMRSAQLYQNEPRFQRARQRAAELAYKNNRFSEAVALTESLPNTSADEVRSEVNYVRAIALLKLEQPQVAEPILSGLLVSAKTPADKKRFANSLALSIYQQAQTNLKNNLLDEAIADYARVAKQASASDIAPDSLYEAISLSVKNDRWDKAVATIELFQQQYPNHRLHQDATRQLSNAYIKLGQGDRAAIALEKVSLQDADRDVKMAALWQAAEIYESKNKLEDAIRTYQEYANNYPTPYPQYLESMHRLAELSQKNNQMDKVNFWLQKIAAADKIGNSGSKNERTQRIAATAYLRLAKIQQSQFEKKRLIEPLAVSLKDKKKLMQESILLYGQASSYNIPEITTESTFSIGKIYQVFSKSLLNSERPKDLSSSELEQYNILIEDQAFPFEEKAIEFFEVNMARTADGVSGPWIESSFAELQILFPSRYQRQEKIAIYRSKVN